jgi:tol-pal system protein YbgF
LLTGAGCASSNAGLRDENASLRLQVSELKSERRQHQRRIHDLEKQVAVLRGGDGRPAPGQRDRSLELPVQVLEPEPANAAGVVEGEVARLGDGVEIVYEGEAAEDRTVRPSIRLYETAGGDYAPRAAEVPIAPIAVSERLPVSRGEVPPIPKPGQAAAPDDDPRTLYRRYYDALRAGNHNFAIVGFRNFVARFPSHDYADNAQYWLGEAFYDQREFDTALAAFEAVGARFPDGNKAPDAALKTAYCFERLGKLEQARSALRGVIARFPNSNAAALARDRLAALAEGA